MGAVAESLWQSVRSAVGGGGADAFVADVEASVPELCQGVLGERAHVAHGLPGMVVS